MNTLMILTGAFALMANQALAKEYIVKEISDPEGKKPYYYSPANLAIQPGDTVTFVNASDDAHDVMFVEVPKGIKQMIMSPLKEKRGDRFSYKFTVPGTYKFHCHPHEELGMNGTLTVGQPSKPGTTVAMNHHSVGAAATAQVGKADGIQANGIVNAVDPASRTVTITHEPIAALRWPKMKMRFKVGDEVDVSGLVGGDRVGFTLVPQGSDDYAVGAITKR